NVYGDPATWRDGRLIFPRTPRNFLHFMSKRPLVERGLV
ncbi:hypothetical protein MEA186_13160, partial [Mesorhizobium amorphae CCNWGS0123]